jgi:hypothetical protein
VRKIRLTAHFIRRWRDRVGDGRKPSSISDLICRRFLPQLARGIRPFTGEDGQLRYVFELAIINEKKVYVVLAPGNQGRWSGWYAITVMTDHDIDDVEDYFRWLYERGGKNNVSE